MAGLLERIHAEIRERLEASRPAVEEYRMLEAALTALDGVSGSSHASGPSSPRPAPKRRAVGPASRAKRAPRGANRAAVLRALGDRPGVGASELSVASGVSRPVLDQLLAKLVDQGEIVKEQLPGGGTGDALRRVGASGSTDTATARAEPVAST